METGSLCDFSLRKKSISTPDYRLGVISRYECHPEGADRLAELSAERQRDAGGAEDVEGDEVEEMAEIGHRTEVDERPQGTRARAPPASGSPLTGSCRGGLAESRHD